tara:strand:+ start:42820 stop:44748 length:1929 start_codon:yes stop_codon:yes gene_type:complete
MKLLNKLLFILILLCINLSGQNLQEIQKLQNEYKKVLEKQALQKPADVSDAENTAKSTALPDKLIYSRKDIESLLVNTENLLNELKFIQDTIKKMPYIGYDFFTKRDSIPFWQNLPIPNNYKLGPGDEVIISLWGESNSYFSEVINRDGQIFIENIGILNLTDKSLIDSKEYIISRFSRVYSTLIGQSPKSFIDLTIGELKSVNVNFVGFVNIPGVHLVHPFSTVITGLIQAGGVDISGSLRDILIIRNGKTISSIDIYNYLLKGENIDSVRLLDQDIVYVQPRKSTIPITGRIRKPGYYEIIDNESIEDLVNFSGGLERKSSNSFLIYRNGKSDSDGYIVNYNDLKDFSILEGDSIHVPQIPENQKFVNIQGQVKNPGFYPYNKKMNLKELLNATMSLKINEFYESMNLSEIKIFRKNPNGSAPIRLIVDINDDIILKNGDYITVSKKDILRPIEAVKITGEVVSPGVYPANESTTLSDVLKLSGGFTGFALDNGIEIFRDSLKIAWERKTFALSAGDSINVLKKSGLVQVIGEVNVPGYISYRKNDSVAKYIKRAGGLTEFAEESNIYITYPNGTSMPLSRWKSPKVKEGSVIYVNQRTISGKEKLSSLQIFSTLSSQAGNIATTLISLTLLANQSNNGN